MLIESASQESPHNIPVEVERGTEGVVDHGWKHTSAVAVGLSGSRPLTWHVVLRFTGAGCDYIEDLGRTSSGGAVGPFGDAGRQSGSHRAGEVPHCVLVVPVAIGGTPVLASQRWTKGNGKIVTASFNNPVTI